MLRLVVDSANRANSVVSPMEYDSVLAVAIVWIVEVGLIGGVCLIYATSEATIGWRR